MDLERAALSIGGRPQALEVLLQQLVAPVVAVVGNGRHDHARTRKAGDVVDVPVGFGRIDTPWQPDDLLGAQVVERVLSISARPSCGLRPASRHSSVVSTVP